MKITAVVVTFNRLELLKQGIECLRKQQKLTGIIVVNNGSTDGTREWLDAQPGLLVVHQDNVGGSGGFYTGIERAYSEGADWIWCMDDDVFPRPDCLDRLLPYTDRPEVGILSPRRLLEGKVFTHEFRHFNFTNPVGSLHGRKLAKQQVNQATEIVGADFEGPFISRRVVEKIGLPNRELFIFCDDTDYCLRAHLAGFKLLYIPEALMDKHKFFSDDTWTSRNRKRSGNATIRCAMKPISTTTTGATSECAICAVSSVWRATSFLHCSPCLSPTLGSGKISPCSGRPIKTAYTSGWARDNLSAPCIN